MGQQHIVEHLDVPQLLEEGDVALQLIAAVDDIVGAHRHCLAPGWIDLDQPDLLGDVLCTDPARADELLHWRIVGEQAVPKDILANLHGGKDGRYRAGGEHVLHADRLPIRDELGQHARGDVGSPHHQDGPFRTRPPGRDFGKVDMCLEQCLEARKFLTQPHRRKLRQ